MSDRPGYIAHGRCYACDKPFSFNPQLVPSVPLRSDGKLAEHAREIAHAAPLCRPCATALNEERGRQRKTTWNITDAAYAPAEGLPE